MLGFTFIIVIELLLSERSYLSLLLLLVLVLLLVSGFGSSRGCRSSVKPEINNRSSELVAMAARKQCVRVERREGLHERKGDKAGLGVFKLDRGSGPQDLEPAGPTPSPELQGQLSFGPNPRPLGPRQSQIHLLKRQQLLRRFPRFHCGPAPPESCGSRRKSNLRSNPNVSAEAPSSLRSVLARQPVHWSDTPAQPNLSPILQRL